MGERFAILLDGGFVTKKLHERTGREVKAPEIVALTSRLMQKPPLQGLKLLRVYYYDALPYGGRGTNPIDGSVTNFATTRQARDGHALLEALELEPDFAVRHGNLMMSAWKLGGSALRNLSGTARALTAKDLVPDSSQKGVDLRIGLDIALLSIKHIVDVIVLVTGDSDLIPAMKFARREGIRVYLDALGHGIQRGLKVHADAVL